MTNLARNIKFERAGGRRGLGAEQAAGDPQPQPCRQDFGVIVRREGPVLIVRCGETELRSRRATSCLVEPEVGDQVLVAAKNEAAYVLAVLERGGDEGDLPIVIAATGDVEWHVPNGQLRIAAQEGISMTSGQQVQVTAASVDVHAATGEVFVDKLTLLGSLLRADVAKVKVVAEAVDSVLTRLTQRVKRSFRTVEETETVRAGYVDVAAEKTMRLRGENTLVTAEELVKVDGSQIHLG